MASIKTETRTKPRRLKYKAMAGEPILIVDDNPVNLKLTRILLVNEGHKVLTAASAGSAGRSALVPPLAGAGRHPVARNRRPGIHTAGEKGSGYKGHPGGCAHGFRDERR
ncbi:hypothetical protein SBA3_4120004 [Candidatus Sulfopaludibacter sp. SbA3]|nr:hypothetical protein SBA3_4120004 [Candidatus Sulfopaludibacter sp. SbA3]